MNCIRWNKILYIRLGILMKIFYGLFILFISLIIKVLEVLYRFVICYYYVVFVKFFFYF